jgi:hypothetical protein
MLPVLRVRGPLGPEERARMALSYRAGRGQGLHSRRVWVEVEVKIQAGLVVTEEVFLPYMQDHQGRTVYERMKEEKFSGLLLTDKPSSPPLKASP